MPELHPRTHPGADLLRHHEEAAQRLRQALATEDDPHRLQALQEELAHHARIVSALRAQNPGR